MATTVKRVRKNPRKVAPIDTFKKLSSQDRSKELYELASQHEMTPDQWSKFLLVHVNEYIKENDYVINVPYAQDHCYGCECED